MLGQDKSKQELIEENEELRRRVAALETAETDRKHTEEALRLSEGRYRALAESTRDIIFILDRQGTLLYANQAASGCIGIPPGDIVGKRQADLFPPEMARSQIEKTGRVFAAGEVIEYDDLFHFGPAEVWLQIQLIPLRDDAGEVTSVMGVCRDITERKKAQESLLEREAQVLEVQEVASLGFYVVDLATGHCTTSAVLDRIFGIPADYERTVQGWAGTIHPDDRQEMLDYFNEVVGEKMHFDREYRIVRYGDKQVRWVHGLGRLRFSEDGEPISMLGTVQDITERKRAEEALRESEERFRLLVEAIPQPIWRSDADGNVMEFNRRWHEYTGQTAEEAKGSGWTKALHSDDAAMVVGKVRAGITSGAAIEIVNRLRRASDGSYRWHLARAIPMADRGGKIIGWFGCATDIDDQKRAEEALRQSEEALQKAHDELEQRVKERTAELAKANEKLRQSEERYELAVRGAGVGIWDWDIRTGKLFFSPRWKMLFGYGENDIGESLDDWAKLLHPDERDWILKFQEDFLAGSSPATTVEYRLRHKVGSYRWIVAHALVVRDEQGRACRMVGSHGDITDRKRAEEALRQSRDELRAIYDGMFDGLLMADIETRHFVGTNAAMTRMLGYSETELLSLSVEDIHPQADLPFVVQQFEALSEGKIQVSEDVPVLRKDGSVFFAQVTSSPVTRDDRRCIAGFFHDVTERKRAEGALRQSHDELQAIYDGMFDGLLVADIETKKYLRTNAAMARMLGYSEAELLSLSVEDVHPREDLPLVLEHFQMFAEGKLHLSKDVPVLRKDGSEFYALVTSSRITFGGRPCLVGIFHDITDRKRAEEALQKEHRNLKHLLHSSDHERQIVAYEIHDGLAQELAAAIMQFDAFDHLKETKPKQAADAYHAAMTMLRQGHFETRRLIAGVRPPILDEEGVVEAVAHLVHELGREKGPKIENHSRVDFDRLDPTLENAIYRIAQEALTNACKHSKSEKVQVSLLQRGDRLRIEIRDWGVGFDPKAVPKNHFGLEGIRQRARLLGGKCSIRSTPGKRTSITVELPVVPRDEEE